MRQKLLRYLPFLLIVVAFVLRATVFQIYKHYPPGSCYETPIGLTLNIDSPGYGACAGDFPKKFIEQTRCGFYFLVRPAYPFALFVLSKPGIWLVETFLPDAAWNHIPVPRDQFRFAAAMFLGIPLNLLIAFLTLIGIRKLFTPYLKTPESVWLAQVLYASSYGASAYIANPIPENLQQLVMVWVPVIFRERFTWLGLAGLSASLMVKELLCLFAAGLAYAWRRRSLTARYLLIPVPLLLWLSWLHWGHGVAIRLHNVSTFDQGVWFFKVFTAPVAFQAKLLLVVRAFLTSWPLSMLPVLPIGIVASIVYFRRLPELIRWNLVFCVLQVLAMGYIDPRITFNFLFMPTLYGTVLTLEIHGGTVSPATFHRIGAALAAAGIASICLFYGISP